MSTHQNVQHDGRTPRRRLLGLAVAGIAALATIATLAPTPTTARWAATQQIDLTAVNVESPEPSGPSNIVSEGCWTNVVTPPGNYADAWRWYFDILIDPSIIPDDEKMWIGIYPPIDRVFGDSGELHQGYKAYAITGKGPHSGTIVGSQSIGGEYVFNVDMNFSFAIFKPALDRNGPGELITTVDEQLEVRKASENACVRVAGLALEGNAVGQGSSGSSSGDATEVSMTPATPESGESTTRLDGPPTSTPAVSGSGPDGHFGSGSDTADEAEIDADVGTDTETEANSSDDEAEGSDDPGVTDGAAGDQFVGPPVEEAPGPEVDDQAPPEEEAEVQPVEPDVPPQCSAEGPLVGLPEDSQEGLPEAERPVGDAAEDDEPFPCLGGGDVPAAKPGREEVA